MLPLSPDWGELALVGNASWIDDNPGGGHSDTEFNKTVLEQNRLGIYNLRLEWRNILGREVDLTLWGRNLSNEAYGDSSDVFASAAGGIFAMPSIIFRDPRTYGVTIQYRF